VINTKDQEMQQFKGQLDALKVSHTNSYNELVKGIDSKMKEYCGWLRDTKLQDTKILVADERGEIEEKTIKQVMEDSRNRIPASLKNDPLVPVVEGLQVGLAIANAKILAYESKKVVDKQIDKDKKEAEPNINSKAGKSGAKADNTIPSLSDMDE
jgi:hypothetical protein